MRNIEVSSINGFQSDTRPIRQNAVLLGFAMIFLVSCSGPKRIDNAAVPLVAMNQLPPPSAVSSGSMRYSYIMPGDQLSVEVFGIEELSREIIVDPDGTIDYPLIGEIKAVGNTRNELSSIIEDKLRGSYVRAPQVSVNLLSLASRAYTITGAVRRAGNYQVMTDMSLLRAVAAAGGLSDDAKLSDVVVFRNVNEGRVAALYNLGDIQVGNYPDVAIYPTDVVVVGTSQTSRFLRSIAGGLPFILAVDRISN